jgi:large subunit ribosomal protein L5e
LKKIGLDGLYAGQKAPDGKDFTVTPVDDGPRPFLAVLDVGLARTTTGARVFLALKGALDGGINIPHSEKRFYGYNGESKKFDPAVLRKAIFGGHVSEYMKKLSDDNPTRYQRQFSKYIEAKINPDKLEELYKKVHAAIRADPTFKKSEKPKRETHFKSIQKARLSKAERDNRIKQKLASHKRKKEAAAKADE